MATAVRTERANLWREFRDTRDFATRNRLVMENLGLVYRIARQHAALAPEAYEDMVQEGCLALIHAVERFRPEYGLQFSTYAYPVISGVIKNFLRDRRRLRGRARYEATAADENQPDHGESLTDPADLEIIAAEGGLDFTDRVVDQVLTDSLLAQMPLVERKLLHQVFYEDLSQREVADRIARSASRISRVLRRAMSRLRSLLVTVQKEERRLTSRADREHERVYDPFVDEETHLFAPTYLYRCLQMAIKRADAYRAPVTLALLRPASSDGASCLSTAAERIYQQVRVMDHVFRAGPRELALIFPLPQQQTATICARIANPTSLKLRGASGHTGAAVAYSLATYPEDATSASAILETAHHSLASR